MMLFAEASCIFPYFINIEAQKTYSANSIRQILNKGPRMNGLLIFEFGETDRRKFTNFK